MDDPCAGRVDSGLTPYVAEARVAVLAFVLSVFNAGCRVFFPFFLPLMGPLTRGWCGRLTVCWRGGG